MKLVEVLAKAGLDTEGYKNNSRLDLNVLEILLEKREAAKEAAAEFKVIDEAIKDEFKKMAVKEKQVGRFHITANIVHKGTYVVQEHDETHVKINTL